ncbi:MAG: type II toxin-antitoxin system death-on-curing family toxin [Phormidium sp. BM_Day4_Bin.17]|nr:type II toxin-antitoxin system death-on-curing family toxin [Phormidium sp. BM_Day4_Bin.17]UCJ13446.1 MAG: type II toxin-antitoxin system death-on-curing family toxin [Phormidium sp. PBR-2020]
MQMPKFVPLTSVLKIHQAQIDQFSGSHGIRDQELLESALAQPQATFGGQYLHPNIVAQAAAYLFHICMNHPFLDGNKRTGLATAIAFLEVNHYQLQLSQDKAYDLMIQVAEHKINKDTLIAYLTEHIKEKF